MVGNQRKRRQGPHAASRAIATVLMVLGLLAARAASAAEEWADPRLEVKEGLLLWLDGSRLNAALAHQSLPLLRNDEPVAVWPDAAGRRRDLVQPAAGRRPLYQADLLAGGTLGAVRFDGIDDHLLLSGLRTALSDLTLVIVAAPLSNGGGYRALASMNGSGKNDYTSGLNLDFGSGGSGSLDAVNIEGSGFGGERSLLDRSRDFGSFHTFTVTSSAALGTALFVDGGPGGRRPRAPGVVEADELRLGARFYSNTADPPFPSGFFHGDIAEVLLFARVLGDEERATVETYLRKKYEELLKLPGRSPGPFLQILAPGFTVRELPVELTNVNGLRYRPDGRLLALGYDGRIHLLTDTDGDGLEDRVEPYWDRPTLRIPIAMVLRPEGLYVTSHGKISLLKDQDGDGKPDLEEVVSEGWEQPEVATGGGVDAMGLAFDSQGNLYFGLGCSDFTNAYRVKDGKPHYDIGSERGTIIRIAKGSKRREILCTGIRFPFALAFNRQGELFATDQEGETWLPGGNPLDELDHILPGRHYGFPPRHAAYLPHVQDEPPVAGFSPQHQSSCGLVFNEARPGWKSFGPASWEGDALVAGYSRGKIWRVRLAKTPAGYLGRPEVIGCARMLTLELALSPAGDLVVACHSGSPDWGSGPNGAGRLFKVSYTGREAPQAVAAWASGPMEARVAFDRPLPALSESALREALTRASITFGDHVRPGDRLEVHRPGYATVQAQMEAPRLALGVTSGAIADGGRTLILATDPHPVRGAYAVSLPPSLVERGEPASPIEFSYDLHGLEARWEGEIDGKRTEHTGWLPHLDLEASWALTRGSAEHERLRSLLARSGRLSLKTRLELPAGLDTLSFSGSAPFEIICGRGRARSETWPAGAEGPSERAVLEIRSAGDPIDLALELETGLKDRPAALHLSYHTGADPTERPLHRAPALLPWAPPARPPAPSRPAKPPPELAGGDWKRGEEVFTSTQARCSSCHTVRGKGGQVGPDLSNLLYRDLASVLRDIVEPSAAINPDYLSYAVTLKDRRLLSGIVRSRGAGEVRILDADARETVIARRDIAGLEPLSVSIMPQGIEAAIGREKLKDLLAYLTTAPPGAGGFRDVPAPGEVAVLRSRAEVAAVLAKTPPAPAGTRPRLLNIVLVAGPKDHGPGEHDYPQWQRDWKELLGKGREVRVSTAWGWPERGQWELADLVVLYFWNHAWSPEQYRDLDGYLERGGGLVALHSSVIPEREPLALADRLGLAWEPGKTRFRHGPLELRFPGPADHPITAGFSALRLVDESYWPLVGDLKRVEVLAAGEEEGSPRPLFWTYRPGKGRVAATLLGHYLKTFDDPLVRVLIFRAMAWAAGEPPGRFDALVTEGLKLGEGP
jgi:putative heme-binding domain-containing protein